MWNLLKTIIPFLKAGAAQTPTPVDDALVMILETIINNQNRAPEVLSILQAHGFSHQ